jgi:hypothetical protein
MLVNLESPLCEIPPYPGRFGYQFLGIHGGNPSLVAEVVRLPVPPIRSLTTSATELGRNLRRNAPLGFRA